METYAIWVEFLLAKIRSLNITEFDNGVLPQSKEEEIAGRTFQSKVGLCDELIKIILALLYFIEIPGSNSSDISICITKKYFFLLMHHPAYHCRRTLLSLKDFHPFAVIIDPSINYSCFVKNQEYWIEQQIKYNAEA